MRNTVSLSIIVTSLLVTVLFQNCGNGNITASHDQIVEGVSRLPSNENERVVKPTSLYNQVIYYKTSQVFDRLGPSSTKLHIDLTSGAMKLMDSKGFNGSEILQNSRDCEIEPDRLEFLSSLLATSKLCTDSQAQATAGRVNCDAIAEPDIQLINDQNGESVNLLENVCHSGLFLCDGLDEKFRKSLLDLTEHPPLNCQASAP